MNAAKTRAGKAGRKMGEAITDAVHLMYQNNTALSYLTSLIEVLEEDRYIREVFKQAQSIQRKEE